MRRLLVLFFVTGCGVAARRPAPTTPATTGPTAAPRARAGLRFPLPGAVLCSRGFAPGERHFALDVPAAEGTDVLASGDGVVVRATGHPSYGLSVILLHDELPTLTYTLYAHLSRLGVALGDRVAGGAKIGEVGHTGNARGAHLHFEVLEADAPLPLRPSGPLGLAGDDHRVDPGTVVALPPGCRGDLAAVR